MWVNCNEVMSQCGGTSEESFSLIQSEQVFCDFLCVCCCQIQSKSPPLSCGWRSPWSRANLVTVATARPTLSRQPECVQSSNPVDLIVGVCASPTRHRAVGGGSGAKWAPEPRMLARRHLCSLNHQSPPSLSSTRFESQAVAAARTSVELWW